MVITSPAAIIALGEQVARETKETYGPENRYKWTNPWTEYDILKDQLDEFSTIEEKINYLRKFEFLDMSHYVNDKKSFELAVKCLLEELIFEREKEYNCNKMLSKMI